MMMGRGWGRSKGRGKEVKQLALVQTVDVFSTAKFHLNYEGIQISSIHCEWKTKSSY